MSQVNARQKLRRLIRMAFAATPNQTWLASALMLGVSTNTLFAQAPQAIPSSAPQTIATGSAAPNAAASTAGVSPEMILKWLNKAADAAGKQETQAACTAFAEAIRGRQMLAAPSEAVNARLKDVEKILLSQNYSKQQIQNAINSLRPLDQSLAALRGEPTSRGPAGALAAAPNFGAPAPGTPTASALAAGGMTPPPPLTPLQPPRALPAGNGSPTNLPPLRGNSNATPSAAAGAVIAAAGMNAPAGGVQTGAFNPSLDGTRLQAAAAQGPLGATDVPPPQNTESGEGLYRQGLEAMSQGNRDRALELFRKAWAYEGELEPALRSQLKDKLAALQTSDLKIAGAEQVQGGGQDNANQEMLLNRSRLMSEILGEIAAAEAHRNDEPQMVSERLQALRNKVSQADLDGAARKQMLSIVDRAITTHQLFMSQNRAAIDQGMKNRQIDEQVAMEQDERYKVDQQLASLTETFNDLMDEQRFAEAEVVAKQVDQLDPGSQLAILLYNNARMAKRNAEYDKIRSARQDNFTDLMIAVDAAAIVPVESQPLVFGDAREWTDLTNRRNRLSASEQQGMSPAAAAIYEKLKLPVQVDFKARPLSEVVKVLGDMTGVLMHIDPAGLATEGLTPDQPVNLSLGSTQMISLRSALNLLLGPHNLGYRVQDEVLLITSARSTAEANYAFTYSVKDLVIPIPNFVSDYNSGMGGALRAAYETLGSGLAAKTLPTSIGAGAMPVSQLAGASMDPNASVLGQMGPGMGGMPGMGMGGMMPWGGGGGPVSGSNPGFMQAGGVGIPSGPAPAKYDELVSLIQQTIDPDSWQSNGGSSTITPFPGNLSLVVSAPQTTHEKLADLLASLRRLQDLQVTIEVRYITLNDNFFEKMGVDFDFRIDDNNRGELPPEDQGRSVTIGMNNNFGTTLVPTADLDLTFTQDSFSIQPPFGGTTTNGGNFGFAILSDIEMFFFLQAAQGDSRTSVLQAPRVTMFDGQSATIQDTVQRPFVVSLIPVVGDFAVGQQPVILVINEGTTLNVQAVVSQDKRFVRLTLNPTFSRIDRVEEFTFQGTKSTSSGTTVIDPATGKPTTNRDDEETVTTGTTVQQPVFATTNVNTTVSVPDGGTILMGGIKRMSEGRTERGIPILSKIPYLSRLFKNTVIGRQTSTLMLTVTPRIIIQEEEEAILLGNTGP